MNSEIVNYYLKRYRSANSASWNVWKNDMALRKKNKSVKVLNVLSPKEIAKILESFAEPSYQEVATTSFIADYFISQGYTLLNQDSPKNYETELFFAKSKGVKVVFRCDLDAVSTGCGVCKHLCGHHVNMTSLLTVAAKVINGDVGFLFQPAEEGPGNSIDRYVHPKGYGGGKYLRSKNIFSKIPKLISCHIDTSLSDNELRITKGQATAAAYRFEIIVKGKPAHAALPWQGLNPIDKSSIILQEIDNLNKEFKKTNDKENYGLITVSQIHSDECELNSLSSRVTLKGISRVSGEQTLSKFLDFMKNHEAKIELEAPPVINDNGLANVAVKAGKALKFKITEEPARFRDETAWAGPLTKLWVEKPESYNPGVKRILHFFTPSYNKRSGGLHSEEFNPNIEKAVNAQVKVLLEISDSISKNEVRKP